MKKAIGQVDDLVKHLNLAGAGIKVDEVECCGAVWQPYAVLWKGAYYIVYTDSTKKKVRNIDTLADEANEIYKKQIDYVGDLL